MTEAKHTPGPWQVGSSSGHNACHVYDRTDDSICTVYGIFAHQSVEQVEHDTRCAEGMANARLIAAAPDMLTLLRRALPGLETLASMAEAGWADHDQAVFDDAKAVIAKAMGPAAIDPGTTPNAHVDETGGSQESKP